MISERNPRKREELEAETLSENSDGFKRSHAELYHNHLPALDAAGFIDWDPETDAVTRGPYYEDIRPLLQLMHDHQDELPEDWP